MKDQYQPTHIETPSFNESSRDIVWYKYKMTELAKQKPIVWVPVNYLWGRQAPREYNHQSERFIKEMYASSQARDWLQENPIWLYACLGGTDNSDNKLIIIDGHHRARYAPKYGMTHIPACIYFEPELTAITGISNIGQMLQDETSCAIYEFSKCIPEQKHPHCSQLMTSETFTALTHVGFMPPATISR